MKMNNMQYGLCVLDDSVSEIPAFNRLGYLPEGVHDACFEEVIKRFATNSIRRALSCRVERFLLKVIDSKICSHVYIGGEFISAKPFPREIELILQTHEKPGPLAFREIRSFLSVGLDTIHEKYSVRLRFWSECSPGDLGPSEDNCQDLNPGGSNVTITHNVKNGMVRVRL